MFLERIEVNGYRGIARLTMNLNNQTVLIGENSWGKSSLLRLLWCVLGNGEVPYEFLEEDFRKDAADYQFERYGEGQNSSKYPRDKDIGVVLVFRGVVLGSSGREQRLRRLYPAWVQCSDSYSRVYYYLHGHMNKNGSVFTEHCFLDSYGNVIGNQNSMMRQVVELLALNPLFRIRDRRRSNNALLKDVNINDIMDGRSIREDMDNIIDGKTGHAFNKQQNSRYGRNRYGRYFSNLHQVEKKLPKFLKGMVMSDGEMIPEKLLKDSIDSINILLEHYFSVVPPLTRPVRNVRKKTGGRDIQDIVLRPVANESFSSLHQIIRNTGKRSTRIILTLIMASFVDDLDGRRIDPQARPILVLEDIESRLHPTVLLSVWNLVDLMPMQKIITTNSGDLLSSVALDDIRRMQRTVKSVECRSIDGKKFTSDEMRRIAFHIRINRPMSLFARAWIFVEGETEIWLINEFAAILGICLQTEGIRLVEYAQCGAGPLIKLANQLGIAWHLLADGDEAGVKYAKNASSNDSYDCVTLLPSVDIEHFLYENGFAEVYRQNCGLTSTRSVNKNKIIDMAIKKRSKPGMALAVVDEARRRGKKSVPLLFQKILTRMRGIANCRK